DDNEITSFSWNLTSSYTPKIEGAKPYLNRLSFSPSASMIFSAKADTSDLSPAEFTTSPSRKFFYPSQIKPFALTMNASGNLISYPKENKVTKAGSVKIPKLNVPAEFAEKTETEETSGEQTETAPTETEITETEATETAQLTEEEELKSNIPLLQTKNPSITDIKGFTYKLDYTISPSLTTEISYDAPDTRNAFEWEDLKSTYFKFTSPVKLNSKLGFRDSFISVTNNLDFSPSIQRHPEYRTESGRETAIKNDYTSQKMDLTNTNSVSFKPFIYSPLLKNTSLSWNTGIKLIQTKFIGTVEKPEWEYELPEWDDDSFSAHTLNFAYAAEQGDYSQKLTLSTNLPPKVDQYNGTLSFGFPFVTTSVSAGIKQKSIEDNDWELIPLNHSSSVKFLAGKINLSNTFKYDLEEKTPSAYNLSLNIYNFSISYSMLYTNLYEYNETVGWKSIAEKEFQPVSINLKYNRTAGKLKFPGDKVKLSPSISTALYYDMQRPTNSYFSFAPSVSFEINDFMTLSF
ncbi:MAG: hypothetical protein IKZ04_05380, partial [Spirochaetaceae bacterium]|nr:hypothetical protein [Spirochaetaceae bacterium]